MVHSCMHALSDPGSEVFVGSWDNTNIDELVETHKTNKVEYSKAYYTVHNEIVDVFIYATFFLILIFSWISLGLNFVVTYVRARKRQMHACSMFTLVVLLGVRSSVLVLVRVVLKHSIIHKDYFFFCGVRDEISKERGRGCCSTRFNDCNLLSFL